MTLGTNIDALGERALTVGETARACNVNPATVWRWRAVGVRGIKLKAVRLGGRTMIRESEFRKFLNYLNHEPAATHGQLEERAAAVGVA